jgi:hypothetical protein
MNPDSSKLRQQHSQEEQLQHDANAEQSLAREFASVDELMRFDASATLVPPIVAERLNESIALEPKPRISWWKRWFS